MRKSVIFALFIVFSLLIASPAQSSGTTTISISGNDFKINGTLTYPGRSVQGLLLNSRMINGIFDDANSGNDWSYPDTSIWDPSRNTSELVGKMQTYANNGLNMVTVGLQGGCPWADGTCDSVTRDENVSAFTSSGGLKSAWMTRLDSVLNAADSAGIVVDLSMFYIYQDQRITSDAGIETAAKNIIDHIQNGGWTNVMLEVCNECNDTSPGFDHANLNPNSTGSLAALISTLDSYAGGTIPISASVTGGYANNGNITSAMLSAMDFVTIHCNSQSTAVIDGEVAAIKLQTSKPIMFNECGTDISKMDAAVDTTTHASWGYYDQGPGGYASAGFQAVPAKWGPRLTPTKSAFFDAVKAYAGL